jgi:hypothetical protein
MTMTPIDQLIHDAKDHNDWLANIKGSRPLEKPMRADADAVLEAATKAKLYDADREKAEDVGVTVVPVLAKFDGRIVIGDLRIVTSQLPPTADFCLALGFTALDVPPGTVRRKSYEVAYKLMCVSPVIDVAYGDHLVQIGKMPDVARYRLMRELICNGPQAELDRIFGVDFGVGNMPTPAQVDALLDAELQLRATTKAAAA